MSLPALLAPTADVSEVAKSRELLDRAMAVTPGGVNTARRKIDPPLCLRRAHGAYLEDLDGNRYIDYHAAYGAILLGHCHPAVNDRVRSDDRGPGALRRRHDRARGSGRREDRAARALR